jgi:hypothetical protein
MMMGYHGVRLWQNETSHCRNQMNIVILITNRRKKQIPKIEGVNEKCMTCQRVNISRLF